MRWNDSECNLIAMFRNLLWLQYLPKVPGTLPKNYEKLYPYQHFNHYALNAPPFPLKQCWYVPETLGIIAHEKFFHYPMYVSQKPTLFKGRRGTNVSSRLKNMQSVPGLLGSIVGMILLLCAKCCNSQAVRGILL